MQPAARLMVPPATFAAVMAATSPAPPLEHDTKVGGEAEAVAAGINVKIRSAAPVPIADFKSLDVLIGTLPGRKPLATPSSLCLLVQRPPLSLQIRTGHTWGLEETTSGPGRNTGGPICCSSVVRTPLDASSCNSTVRRSGGLAAAVLVTTERRQPARDAAPPLWRSTPTRTRSQLATAELRPKSSLASLVPNCPHGRSVAL